MTSVQIMGLIGAAAVGTAAAWISLKMLHRTIQNIQAGTRFRARLAAGFAIRLAGFVLIFLLFLRQGPWPALVFFISFWAARQHLVRRQSMRGISRSAEAENTITGKE